MKSIIQTEFIKFAFKITKRSLPKNNDVFSYKVIAEDMWRDLWKDATKHFDTNFDWENNDSTGERRAIVIKHTADDGVDFNYTFNCDLFSAGGDWENPCYYFRCQIKDGSFYADKNVKLLFPGTLSSYGVAHFILIPPKDAGNTRLIKTKDGSNFSWMAMQNSDTRDEDVPELDSKKAWAWVQTYLENLVKDYIDKRPRL